MIESLSFTFSYVFIFICCGLGLLFGLMNWLIVANIDAAEVPDKDYAFRHGIKEEVIIADEENQYAEKIGTMIKTAEYIQNGSNTFLYSEYIYIGIFSIVMFIVIFLIDKIRFYSAISFLVGSITSLLCGYIGMYVATRTNYRVTYMAAIYKNEEDGLKHAFNTAFRGGSVMGFVLVSLALAVLTIVIIIHLAILKPQTTLEYTQMFDFISGYGLGGSCVALFCRVGGGIYTKAADVGADLVGKNEYGLDEDSPDNPATIADNVGDNVGDIAGMGADLFGSFAEATCAALVVSGTSSQLTSGNFYMFPLNMTAAGIICCIITSFFATDVMSVNHKDKIQMTLTMQVVISTVLVTPAIVLLSLYTLPEKFSFVTGLGTTQKIYVSSNIGVMVSALVGLYSGLIIGFMTDYFTSNQWSPTQDLANSCKSGAAINIIQGLALGYLSNVIPIFLLALTVCVSFVLANMYGVAIAALGMLSNLSTSLAIDAYGPIADNAGGISEMSGFPKEVRDKTDALDAAGNTTAAIGKGFAIGSAALVGLALFGAFTTRAKLATVNLLEPLQLSSVVLGAMIPYAFCAMTMKSVGLAAAEMCESIKIQIQNRKEGEPLDYNNCIQISTNASLKEMIAPGLMIILTPLVLGFLLGPKCVAGYLIGLIVAGIQLAFSQSNSGGAWDNAKKYIEAQRLLIQEDDFIGGDHTVQTGDLFYSKKSRPHKAAVVGDTVGDPLKDTSGPSLNIVVKLSSIVSLVFGAIITENHLIKDANH
jgi:H(+)-translocating pyrophosphatase